MTAIEYPIHRHGLPIQLARELAKAPDEEVIAEALRSAYATGYTQAIACLGPDLEWDLDRVQVPDTRGEKD